MHRRDVLATAFAAPLLGASGGAVAASTPPRREAEVRTKDGVVLRHRDWGQGRTILFASAWAFPSDAWQYQMIPLSQQGFRCVTYDRRGHGATADPGHGFDIDTLADDLNQVMETLDLRDVVLVGYSMGAVEATRCLARHGQDRVAKVLYLAPVTPCLAKLADNPAGVDPAVFASNRATMAKDFPAALAAGFAGFMDKGCSEPMKAWVRGLMLQNSLHALIECQAAFSGADVRADLKRITRPALVIQGDADQSAPPPLTGRRTAEMLGCEFRVYPGSPHGVPFTDTDRLNADIAAFARA